MKRIFRLFNTPAPVWLVALLMVSTASAATSLYVGSLKIPTGATITDTNATASSCVGTTGLKVYTYGTNCVTGVSASGNIASSGGANPNITFTGTLPIASGGTGSGTKSFVDLTTNQTIAGSKSFSSAVQVLSSYVPPVYTTAGAAVANTLHGVVIAGTWPSATSTCGPYTGTYCISVTLSGSAVFSSASSWDCGGGPFQNVGATQNDPTSGYYGYSSVSTGIATNDGTHFYLSASSSTNPSGATFHITCWGT